MRGTLFFARKREIRVRATGQRDSGEGFLLDMWRNDLRCRRRQLTIQTLVILAQFLPPPLRPLNRVPTIGFAAFCLIYYNNKR
jgi:hypothetical protein